MACIARRPSSTISPHSLQRSALPESLIGSRDLRVQVWPRVAGALVRPTLCLSRHTSPSGVRGSSRTRTTCRPVFEFSRPSVCSRHSGYEFIHNTTHVNGFERVIFQPVIEGPPAHENLCSDLSGRQGIGRTVNPFSKRPL